ncbi:MAG: tetratricopeptide repeat protein [Halobacteriota archaeon]
MSQPFGVGWEVWISGAIAIAIALIGSLWKLGNWKGGLDQWKKGVDDWRTSMDNRFDKLVENINTLMSDVAVIKSASEKDATRNGMLQRHSPLVPSEKAIEILDDLNILSQVDANIPYIQDEIEKRSQISIYREIEDPEERFIEIAPSVIHALIKKGKIEDKKIDKAMDRLEQVFPTVTYYGVLLLIAAYILEKGSEKGFIAKPSMIYSQIDMAGLKDRDELLASFDGDAEKAIKSLEMSIRSLEEIGNKKELARDMNKLAGIYEYVGRRDEAEKECREAIRIYPDFAKAHYNLGNLLSDMGRKEDAEAEYREAIGINPHFAEAHNNLGALLGNKGREDDAEAEFREALRINPNEAEAHHNLGASLGNMGREEDAKAEYRDALRINPDFAVAHRNLGILYSKTGKKEEAKKELTIAKRLFDEQGREADVKTAEELLKSLKV